MPLSLVVWVEFCWHLLLSATLQIFLWVLSKSTVSEANHFGATYIENYCPLCNNQITMLTLIGLSAMVYCAGKLNEKAHVF